jgi:hypothetical protein
MIFLFDKKSIRNEKDRVNKKIESRAGGQRGVFQRKWDLVDLDFKKNSLQQLPFEILHSAFCFYPAPG